MPDLTGQSVADAEATLRLHALRLVRADKAGNVVASQQPAKGTRVKLDSVVTVGTGVQVPDVRGQSDITACSTLAGAGLGCTHDGSGTVRNQTPSAGDIVPPGTPVRLEVQLPQVPTVVVPNMANVPEGEVCQKLDQYRLKCQLESSEQTNGRGLVVSQRPQPGTAIQPNSTVYLTVEVPRVVMPAVRTQPEDLACDIVEQAGLVCIRKIIQPGVEPGKVTGQHPEPGEPVKVGDEVIVEVERERAKLSVPDVATSANPCAELERVNLRCKTELADRGGEPGKVLEMRPNAGSVVTEGTEITLVVQEEPGWLPVDVIAIIGAIAGLFTIVGGLYGFVRWLRSRSTRRTPA